MDTRDFNFHCRNCSIEHLFKPDPKNFDYQDMLVREFYGRLKKCKSLFLFHQNIIATGPDSFVLVDDTEYPENVIKVYTKTSLGRVERYREEMEDLGGNLQGKGLYVNGKFFEIVVNPIMDVFKLENGCVATTSRYIPLPNEYTRYQESYRSFQRESISGEENDTYLINYEKLLSQEIGIYIDPRNFVVDEEEGLLIITDKASCLEED